MEKALILVDYQNEWIDLDSEYYVGDLDELIIKTNNVIKACRNKGYKIIFTRHIEPDSEGAWSENLDRSKIIGKIDLRDNDIVIKKNKISSFYRTDLEKELEGTEEIIVCGILTNLCVRSLIQDAYDRNFKITVLQDCCAAFDQETHEFTIKDIKATREEVVFIDSDYYLSGDIHKPEIKVKYFLKTPEIREYLVQDIILQLEIDGSVFPPPIKPPITTRYMKVKRDETVIDIGTGSGILAVLAAKMGGKVFATDISEDAITLTNKNAERNGVEITTELGSFFGSRQMKFDVILANLSQTIVPNDYKEAIGKLSGSIDGGYRGNDKMLEVLVKAKDYMHVDSRMYMVIYTISDYSSTICKMLEIYDAKLLALESEPTKEFVEDNIMMYSSLDRKGIIDIFKDGEAWKARQYLFELKLKK